MERKKFIKYIGLISLLPMIAKGAFLSMKNLVIDHKKCRLVWEQLCGKSANTKTFEYVLPQKGLPNVLLYGDSISVGYTVPVRDKLKGKANVIRLHRNGASSNEFVQYMEEMEKAMFQPYLADGWNFEWDLIHFNVGLHDLKYVVGKQLDKEKGKQVSSLDTYRKNLMDICRYLSEKHSNSILVFATTTPVPEGEAGRFAEDELNYNRMALEVLADFPKIKINDLHSYIAPHFKEWTVKPGNVHYNEKGKQEQGNEVARIISGFLV